MKIIFDVGAYDGMSGLGLLQGDPNCMIYSFEAAPHCIKMIKDNYNNNAKYILTEKAVSDKNGTANFNFCRNGGASSLCEFKNDNELVKHWSGRPDVQYSGISILVETIRLDTFIEQNNIKQIDYLHIDTQGYDLNVLQSLGNYVGIVLAGECEVASTSDTAIYSNQTALLYEVQKWLVDNNFIIESIRNNGGNSNEMLVKFKKK